MYGTFKEFLPQSFLSSFQASAQPSIKNESSPAIPFGSFGSLTEEILNGKKGVGSYTLDHGGSLKATTSSGWNVTASASQPASGAVSSSLKATSTLGLPVLMKRGVNGGPGQMLWDTRPIAEKAPEGCVPKVNCTASLSNGRKLGLDFSSKVAHGTTLTFGSTLAWPGSTQEKELLALIGSNLSSKLTLDYANDKVIANVNTTASAQPTIGVTVASGVGPVKLGMDVKFDTAKGASAAADSRKSASASGLTQDTSSLACLIGGLTSWNMGAHYAPSKSSEIAAYLSKGKDTKVRVVCARKLSDRVSMALEAAKEVTLMPLFANTAASSSTAAAALPTFSVGLATRLPAGASSRTGAGLAKWKFNSDYKVSFHYSDVLMMSAGPPVTLGVSCAMDVRKPITVPRVGVTMDVA